MRLQQQQGLPQRPPNLAQVQAGQLEIEKVTAAPEQNLQGAMIHDWRGVAFAPGVTAAKFERLMRDYDNYPHYYGPEVRSARVLQRNGERDQVALRMQQKHVITVVLDAVYDVSFGRCDQKYGSSASRSTRIDEIADPGGADEHPLSAADNHGFLWRQNTYWTWSEEDGGLYIQVEAVSLTRSIPKSLAWVVDPFVESVPRESLEFTLRATRTALEK